MGLKTPLHPSTCLAGLWASVYCTAKWVDNHTLALLGRLLCPTVNYITRLQWL